MRVWHMAGGRTSTGSPGEAVDVGAQSCLLAAQGLFYLASYLVLLACSSNLKSLSEVSQLLLCLNSS